MKTQEQIEQAIGYAREQYLRPDMTANNIAYLEGQLVALKWIIEAGMWFEIGDQVRQLRRDYPMLYPQIREGTGE